MFIVENVHKSFGDRIILNNVSMKIDEGSISTITGKSGSGKTTLLGIISGLLAPDKGKIFFNNNNIFNWIDFRRSHFRNKKIGFVFQFFNLLPDLTAYENIVYPVIMNPFSRNIKDEAEYLINYLNLFEIKDQYPGTLSGGERQRVAIARAIINKPALILADEPTGNLDDKIANDIIKLFLDINKEYNIAFLIVTHDKRFLKIAQNKYHLESGILSIENSNKKLSTKKSSKQITKKSTSKSAKRKK